jgi:hypothetical protein
MEFRVNTSSLIRLATFPALIALFLLSFAVFSSRPDIQAQTPGKDVPTGAEVGGTNVAAHIECAWALPDVDSTVAGIQYGQDDDANVNPGGPCDGNPAQQADGVHHMIQVKPNAEDLPEPQRIQLWVAADHQNGLGSITGAFFKVYHPDGTPKVQVDATANRIQGQSGSCPLPDGMLTAAGPTTTNQVSSTGATSLLNRCNQGVKAFFYGEFDLHKYQACGEYKIEAYVTSTSAPEAVLTFYIDVPCVNHLRIDFEDGVNWGAITPGQEKIVIGDSSDPASIIDGFAPTNSPYPTVKNVGNSGMSVRVEFGNLVQQNVQLPKQIVDFDACFGRTTTTIVCLNQGQTPGCPLEAPYPAGCNDTVADFSSFQGRDQTLCANEDGKLDLSIHPVANLPTGVYQGRLQVIAVSTAQYEHCGENGVPATGGG